MPTLSGHAGVSKGAAEQGKHCNRPKIYNVGVKQGQKENALTANRTRGQSMATIEVTTTPLTPASLL
jgi:hypothetical protein